MPWGVKCYKLIGYFSVLHKKRPIKERKQYRYFFSEWKILIRRSYSWSYEVRLMCNFNYISHVRYILRKLNYTYQHGLFNFLFFTNFLCLYWSYSLLLPDKDMFLDVKLVTDVTHGSPIRHNTDDINRNKNKQIDLVLFGQCHLGLFSELYQSGGRECS